MLMQSTLSISLVVILLLSFTQCNKPNFQDESEAFFCAYIEDNGDPLLLDTVNIDVYNEGNLIIQNLQIIGNNNCRIPLGVGKIYNVHCYYKATPNRYFNILLETTILTDEYQVLKSEIHVDSRNYIQLTVGIVEANININTKY